MSISIGLTILLFILKARTVKNVYVNSGCNNKFINNVCSKLGKGGKCVNLSPVDCQNIDNNNITL